MLRRRGGRKRKGYLSELGRLFSLSPFLTMSAAPQRLLICVARKGSGGLRTLALTAGESKYDPSRCLSGASRLASYLMQVGQ